MECRTCGAEMRIIGAKNTEKDGEVFKVLTHKCTNTRCSNNATAETQHRIGVVVSIEETPTEESGES